MLTYSVQSNFNDNFQTSSRFESEMETPMENATESKIKDEGYHSNGNSQTDHESQHVKYVVPFEMLH